MRTLLALLTLAAAAPAADLDELAVARTVTAALARWRAPGAVVAVVQGDRAVVGGYGVKSVQAPAAPTADTLVPLASCTKAVTTTLLAMLADEGKLAWDDPVRKHVPNFHVSDPNVDALITLRDLVSHRSGVRGHDLLWYRAPWDEDEVFRRIVKLPVERAFRGSFEYSTIMVMAAGRAAELSAGKPWADQVRLRIADPLGMKGVLFSTADPRFATADRMTGHRPGPTGPTPMPRYETAKPNAAGSIYLTARDLVPWLRFHLASGAVAVGGKQLVSRDALDETKKPLTPIPMDDELRRLNPDTVQMSYAMGWLVYDYRGHAVVAHGGLIDGFRTQVTLFPRDNLGIAVVNNLHDSKMNQAVTNALADRALDLPPKDWDAVLLDAVTRKAAETAAAEAEARKNRRPNLPPTFPLADYAGTYADAAYGDAEVRLENGKLVWRWSSFVAGMEHWEADTFRLTEGFLENRLIGFRVGKGGPNAFRFETRTFERK